MRDGPITYTDPTWSGIWNDLHEQHAHPKVVFGISLIVLLGIMLTFVGFGVILLAIFLGFFGVATPVFKLTLFLTTLWVLLSVAVKG